MINRLDKSNDLFIRNESESEVKPQTWVRELVDPGKTLPKVEILSPNINNIRNIQLNGSNVGWLVVGRHENGNTKLDYIRVQSDTKGCGLAAYISVIEETLNRGETFQSDLAVSEDAVKIWNILVEKKVATIVEPFIKINKRKFSGDYRIKPR